MCPGPDTSLIVSLTKGLELGTYRAGLGGAGGLMFPRSTIGVLTGPTNAEEFVRGLPAAMVRWPRPARGHTVAEACRRRSATAPCASTRATIWRGSSSAAR